MRDIDEICEIYEKDRRRRIVAAKESYNESNVYCPHCGIEVSDYHEILPNSPEEWEESECGSCEKSFELQWCPTYSTKAL